MITSLGLICIDQNQRDRNGAKCPGLPDAMIVVSIAGACHQHKNLENSIDSQLMGCLSCKIGPERQKQGRMPGANWTAGRHRYLPRCLPLLPQATLALPDQNGRNPCDQMWWTPRCSFICKITIVYIFNCTFIFIYTYVSG